MELTCDPYGSSLQLHCAITGPLDPLFHIEWYLSALDESSEIRLDSSDSDYRINNNVLDVVGDVENQVRSISSILATGPISGKHANQCLRCQVEFVTFGVTLARDDEYKLCFGDMENYTALASCGDDLVIFNSSFCATSEDFSVFPVPTLPSPSHTIPQPSPTAKPPHLGHSSSHLVLPIQSTTHTPTATSIDLVTVAKPTSNRAPTTITMPPSPIPGPNGQQGAVEGGLFVAIGICVIFIVIIIILMYFVVRLFRQWRWKRSEAESRNQDTSEY